jgi:hypothetical protein
MSFAISHHRRPRTLQEHAMSAYAVNPTPDHELEQRRQALAIANSTRTGIARFRSDTRALPRPQARDAVINVLLEPGPLLGAMHVRHLLLTIHQVGHAHADAWLKRAGVVSGDRKIRQLTVRQRESLADRVREAIR